MIWVIFHLAWHWLWAPYRLSLFHWNPSPVSMNSFVSACRPPWCEPLFSMMSLLPWWTEIGVMKKSYRISSRYNSVHASFIKELATANKSPVKNTSVGLLEYSLKMPDWTRGKHWLTSSAIHFLLGIQNRCDGKNTDNVLGILGCHGDWSLGSWDGVMIQVQILGSSDD